MSPEEKKTDRIEVPPEKKTRKPRGKQKKPTIPGTPRKMPAGQRKDEIAIRKAGRKDIELRNIPTPKVSEIEDAVARWMALPQNERPFKTLTELFNTYGWKRNRFSYAIASSPRTYHKMLVHVAGDALKRTPEVLRRLADDAASSSQRGNNAAAEIFLNHVRKTISDERMFELIKPELTPLDMLNSMVGGARDLLKLAQALGNSKEEAEKRFPKLKSMVQGEIEDAKVIEEAEEIEESGARE